jgi:ectoine hydroxylase-related dioxygenase (phytanoyl-CoA dioxygenase family)
MKTAMLKPIVEQFDRDGYVIVRDVLDDGLIGEMREHVEWLNRTYPGRVETEDHNRVRFDAFWLRVVSDPRLLDIAEAFIGPDIALFASSYFTKQPYTGVPVLWHQDGVFWPLEPMEVVTVWLAVDDSTPENGCLRVIPGTHKMDFKEWQAKKDVPNALEAQIDPRFVEEDKAVDLILKAGDVSIHHPNIIHGSNANVSPHRRCGLTVRYIPTSTRIVHQPWSCQFLLRGNPVEGINDYMPFPKYEEGVSMPFRGKEGW